MNCFVALDFETADQQSDSACAVGLVRVENGKITQRLHQLIRPPRQEFVFTYIHGITWHDVAEAHDFEGAWPTMTPFFEGVDFIAAHNASFDRRVLEACCARYGLSPPPKRYVCTVQLAREAWRIFPTKLPDVCAHLGITLKHHEALSDAEACAQIVMAAQKEGFAFSNSL